MLSNTARLFSCFPWAALLICLCLSDRKRTTAFGLTERQSLVRFYNLANGKRWRVSDGWKQAAESGDDVSSTNLPPVCSWHGIKCDGRVETDDSGVTHIELPGNQLSGKVSKHLWTMPNLKIVNLRANDLREAGFEGFVEAGPDDKFKAPVESIVISENKLTSVSGIGAAPQSLTELHISSNLFEGPFPEEIFTLRRLKSLLATYNRGITGTLPTTVGQMANLKQLLLWYNSMDGTLPTELGTLNKLESLGLDENKFIGSLPTEMNNMLNLRYISCQNFEDDTGVITGRLPSFENLVYLKDIFLDGNQLTGTIPKNFLMHSTVTDLPVTIGLMHNSITGSVPSELGQFKRLQLDIVGNKIVDIPKELCKINQWMAGSVEQFGCDAILCPKGTYSSVGRQDSEEKPCIECANGLSGAPFMGMTQCAQGEAEVAAGSAKGDQQILVELALATDWPKWSEAGGWADALKAVDSAKETATRDLDYCNFYGVVCSDATSKRVVELNLKNNGLRGKVPRSLFDLTELAKLDLSHNYVHLSSSRGFGDVGKAKKLEVLSMDQTDIRVWDGIGAATGLKVLSINDVYMDGPLSDEFFQLKNLVELRAQFAGLKGPLPTRIGELTELERLNLYGNRFNTTLPVELGNLQKIHILDLSENSFTGLIPTSLNGLHKLQRLEIHQSSRDGDGLRGSLPLFDDLPNLNTLRLDSNSLTGSISPQFLSGISDLDRELTIGLSYNLITGTVPGDLNKFSRVNFDLVGNKIASISSNLCSNTEWSLGEVGAVGSCDAILCPKGTYSVYGMASKKFNASCADCPTAAYMGSVSCASDAVDYSERKFLDKFYDLTGGPNWAVPNSWTESGVHFCDYEGITCEGGTVTQLRLNNFGLSGEVPSDLWSELPNLKLVAMRNNSATVSFDGIGAATNLEYLDLSETDVRSLEGIGAASTSLSALIVEWNSLSGSFPQEILGMSQLSRLNLNHNHFSGAIPSDIKKMTDLKEFSCYNCDFDSEIASEIGLLSNLEMLDLGKNLLTGFIPTEVGNLKKLKSLTLDAQRSGSRISGPLPDFKENSQLTMLMLRENALAGTIPQSFMASVPRNAVNVHVDLSDNKLTGTIPLTLTDFYEMSIYLGDNMITNVPPDFCDESKSKWMERLVGKLGTCDAILCPPGYHSPSDGRQTSAESPCQKCPFPTDSPYWGSSHCGTSERGTLLELYEVLGGPTWAKNKDWGTDEPICTWEGITCSDDRPTDEERVSELSLEDNNLQSNGKDQLASTLFFKLPHLTSLDLKGNSFSMKFDEIGLARNLKKLILSSTQLSSLAGIGSAKNLQELHLTDNSLNGTLEESGISELVNLESLFISYNHFSGDILSIVGLPKLIQVYAYQNQFSSSIPATIASLANIKILVLGENYLTGTIPSMPTSLVQLSLFNQLSDEKISGRLPDFASLPYLTTLDVENNKLTGSIPDTFLSSSSKTAELVKINLSYNDLTGTVPTTLDSFRQLELGIVGNKITSIPNNLCDGDNSAWMGGEVGRIGNCAAIACPAYSWSETGAQTELNVPCSACPEMGNAYVGNKQCVKENRERDILMELFASTRGVYWEKKYGWGSTDIPLCSWVGVKCSDGSDSDDQGITELNLEKFELDGDIPTSIYSLPFLKEINLRYNYDAILSFQGIRDAANLEVMRLSETIVNSLDGLGQAPNLRRLHLTGCDLWGPWPKEILDLAPTLKQLFIAYNDLTGPLPTEIGKMEHLTDLFAYDNSFTGTVPSEIGQLKNLENFVFAENLISGQLPSEVSSLPSLQLFSIFRREKEGPMLTGTIPTFASAPSLTDLYLDGNEIGGSIPPSFLSSSSNIYLVTVANNKLTGEVPAVLGDLPPFQLEMEGNLISVVPDVLCRKKDMMRGDVGIYGCDAILCKPGSASVIGRQNSTDTKCEVCSDSAGAMFWGSLSCGAQDGESTILSMLYDKCGGDSWVNKDNWKSKTVPVCQWHGVSCNDKNMVQAIRLGSNNLIGTPPSQLFDLPQLKWLWLHSNPIQFSFRNIGNARELIELRLDSTGLTSVEGLGDAKSLQILDLRFNKLLGPFPEDVLLLKQLEVLSLADNDLRGHLPDISGLGQLKTLRLGSNRFSGNLPAFDSSFQLRAMDLSQNELAGSIPSSFLEAVSTDSHVELNLASNKFTGSIPVELDRFRDMTIYLRDNMITSLPSELCDGDNYNWNSGDVGRFSCDALLCPPGTFNSLGRQSTDQSPCIACDGVAFFGQVKCVSGSSSGFSFVNQDLSRSAVYVVATIFSGLLLTF